MRKNMLGLILCTTATLGTLFYASNCNAELNHSDAVVKMGEFKVNETSNLWLGFKVHNGFKWNKDFPLKVLFLSKPVKAKLLSASYENSDAHVKGNLVLVPVELRPIAPGSEMLEVVLRFSVCNEVSCHIESVRFDIGLTYK